jgi:uncharacterized membrane protein (DUF373 family)
MISAVGMQTSALIAIVVLLVALSRVLASLSRGDSSPTNGCEPTGEPTGRKSLDRATHHEFGPKFGVIFRALSWAAVGLAVAVGTLAIVEATLNQRWESRSSQRVEAWRASDVAVPDS